MGHGMREMRYEKELASADIAGHRIERLHVNESGQEEIRFSWWKDGKFQARPLDLPEDQLLILFGKAIDNGVFTANFLAGLQRMLNRHLREAEQ
jgi:hypothetical protein